jgi:hypothetical protein
MIFHRSLSFHRLRLFYHAQLLDKHKNSIDFIDFFLVLYVLVFNDISPEFGSFH